MAPSTDCGWACMTALRNWWANCPDCVAGYTVDTHACPHSCIRPMPSCTYSPKQIPVLCAPGSILLPTTRASELSSLGEAFV